MPSVLSVLSASALVMGGLNFFVEAGRAPSSGGRLGRRLASDDDIIHYTTCTEMQFKENLWLDRQTIEFSSEKNRPIHEFKLSGPHDSWGCGTQGQDSTFRRFEVTTIADVEATPGGVQHTPWNEGANAGIVFFDRHDLDCNPGFGGEPKVMTSFKLDTNTGFDSKIRFQFTCGSLGGKHNKFVINPNTNENNWWGTSDSGWHSTDLSDAGHFLDFLDRHRVECPPDMALAQLKGHAQGNQFQWMFRCLKISSKKDPNLLLSGENGATDAPDLGATNAPVLGAPLEGKRHDDGVTTHYTTCTEMQFKENLFLDRQTVQFSDSKDRPIVEFQLSGPHSAWGCSTEGQDSAYRRFEVTTMAGATLTPEDTKYTPWNDGADAGIVFFDRHDMDCNQGWPSDYPRVMTSWKLETQTGFNKQMRFKYTCGSTRDQKNEAIKVNVGGNSWWGTDDAGWMNTGFNDAGHFLDFLDRHHVECPPGQALAQLKGDTKGSQFRWMYRCLEITLGKGLQPNGPLLGETNDATPRPTLSGLPLVTPKPTLSGLPLVTPKPTLSGLPLVTPKPTLSGLPLVTSRPTAARLGAPAPGPIVGAKCEGVQKFSKAAHKRFCTARKAEGKQSCEAAACKYKRRVKSNKRKAGKATCKAQREKKLKCSMVSLEHCCGFSGCQRVGGKCAGEFAGFD